MTDTPAPDSPSDSRAKTGAHRRRPRYSGKNPRRFEEKYKEHDPARHAETVAKVVASGKTVAGTHRPIMVAEILEVPLDHLEAIVARLADLGAKGITLADTTGMANPAQVARTFERLMPKWPHIEWHLHTHDTRAMAIPNILAAMECGVTHFDSSVGGLGGCPFAPGASGNVCTEDLVHCLHAMDVATGIDLDRLLAASRRVQEIVGRALPGQIVKAGPSTRRYPVPDTVAGRLTAARG